MSPITLLFQIGNIVKIIFLQKDRLEIVGYDERVEEN